MKYSEALTYFISVAGSTPAEPTMNVLAYDLGASTGFAVLSHDGYRIASGCLKLGKRSGFSYHLFEATVRSQLAQFKPELVAYELVRRHRGVEAAHAYGAYEAILLKALYLEQIATTRLTKVSVQEAKRAATGRGNADKEDLEAAAMLRWAHITESSDESDALWIAEAARKKLIK